MKPIDLCIPIYLNQQAVFDMLAILEDGFSTLRTITTSAAETQSQRTGIGGSIGLSNVFALLGVTFGAKRDKEKECEERMEERQERVHTPVSLFAKLRAAIQANKLLQRLDTSEAIMELRSGDFVEFQAVLRKNPLVDVLESMKRAAELAFLSGKVKEKSGSGGGKKKGGAKQQGEVIRQIDALLKDLTGTGTLELIAELVSDNNVKAVLSTRLDYFLDRAASEVADGEFFVLGKVVRIVKRDETLNLLRKTSFGLLRKEKLEQLVGLFASADKAGLNLPELIIEIPGPALQVFPIAVFL